MKKAVNQWCFPNGTPLVEVLSKSSQAGFEGVELNLYETGQVGLTLESTTADAKAVKQLANRYGIELKSLSTGLLWAAPLSSPDRRIRAKGISIVRKQLELASEIEMDTILVVPGAVTKHVSYEECYKRSRQEIGSLATEAERLGVRIGVETVSYT